jgi:hypothetical protein
MRKLWNTLEKKFGQLQMGSFQEKVMDLPLK